MTNSMPKVISGKETSLPHDSPAAALSQFYKAFNNRDMTLMESNWLQASEASMSNPLGGIKRGWQEIRQVYERIFFGDATVCVEYYDFTIHEHDNMFCAVGRERGSFKKTGVEVELAIRTSRIYLSTESGWRQLHHHGSIEAPVLLDEYQRAIKK